MFENPLLTEADATALGLGMSINEIKALLSTTIKEAEPTDPDGDGDNDTWIYIYDLYPSPPTVIYETGACIGDDGPYRMRSFTIDAAARTATLGDPVVVARKTVWLPVAQQSQESNAPPTLYLAEAGSRHSEADRAKLHSIATHADSIKTHVTELGASAPTMGSTYGAGFFPMLQSTRESEMAMQESGNDVPILEAGMATISESKSAPDKGLIEMTIIRPGFNASASRYYTKEAIAGAATNHLFENRHMFIDHPTVKEEKDLPERSVAKIGAVIKETYLGTEGELRGKAAIVNPQLKDMLSLMKEQGVLQHIGVSINAVGTVRAGKIDGKSTNVVEAFTVGKSVDFVTEPGAGGRIGLYESDRGDGPVIEVRQGDSTVNEEQIKDMLAKLTALEASNAALTAKVTESDERAQLAEGRARVQAEVARRLAAIPEAELPAISKERVASIFESATTCDRLDEAIDREKAYVKEVAERLAPKVDPAKKGAVSGLGSRVSEGAGDALAPVRPSENDSLLEAMKGMHGGKDAARTLLEQMAG